MKFRNYKIKQSLGDIETHHVFLDTLANKKSQELGFSEKKFEVPLSRGLIYFLFTLFFLSAAILFSKALYFQVMQGAQLYVAAENNKGRVAIIPAQRGIIYDKNLNKLVLNSPDFDLFCAKKSFEASTIQNTRELQIMASVLGVTTTQLNATIQNSQTSHALIMQNIPQETLLVLETKIQDLPDCFVQRNTLRNYTMGPMFSHLLGYMGKPSKDDVLEGSNYSTNENIGKTGLEKYYQDVLRGIPGRVVTDTAAKGEGEGKQVLTVEKPGYNLVLNIDQDLQKAAYEALEKSIKNIGSKKGAVVVMDPRNGAVLALVSYPAYDNNIFSGGISQTDFSRLINDPNQPFFNRAVGAKYPTGSTIKPFEATGVLQERLIDPNKQINDPGYILVHSQYDPSITYKFGGVTPHGWVDMRKALAVSSNIYFYTVGGGYGNQKGLGPAGIKKYLGLYGWEEKTGIDLPGEFKGFIPTPDWKKEVKGQPWWDGDSYNLAIGQSDLQVTPIQVAMAYSYIANGGTLYKPQIVNRIVDGAPSDNPTIIKEFKPQIIRQHFIDTANLQVVREGMRDGVEKDYGSSHMLSDIGVSVAGKTGTAEIGKEGHFNTWSSAFAPYDNSEIVVVSTIEEVRGLRAATLPVTHDILKFYFDNKSQ